MIILCHTEQDGNKNEFARIRRVGFFREDPIFSSFAFLKEIKKEKKIKKISKKKRIIKIFIYVADLAECIRDSDSESVDLRRAG